MARRDAEGCDDGEFQSGGWLQLLQQASVDPVVGSKLEDAVNYALNQEQYLRAFLKNGEVEISNNFAENAIRPFVIGRKNWLFSDTVKGAKSSAIIYSLIETAKANGVEPYVYLTLVLTDMQYMGRPFSNEELENFMPWSEELKESIAQRTKQASSVIIGRRIKLHICTKPSACCGGFVLFQG